VWEKRIEQRGIIACLPPFSIHLPFSVYCGKFSAGVLQKFPLFGSESRFSDFAVSFQDFVESLIEFFV
jgi:hypothetical protein